MNPVLSILTPTIPSRVFDRLGYTGPLAELIEKVESQIGSLPVEHLWLGDNCKRTIGAKRQALVDVARGRYIAFCDDDDDVSPDYVARLLKAAESNADVITFKQQAIYNGRKSEIVFGINNPEEQFNDNGTTLRAPWHVCAWKREVVAGCLFGESNYKEDLVWCHQARKRIRTGHHIDAVLHTYRHDAATTAAPERV